MDGYGTGHLLNTSLDYYFVQEASKVHRYNVPMDRVSVTDPVHCKQLPPVLVLSQSALRLDPILQFAIVANDSWWQWFYVAT